VIYPVRTFKVIWVGKLFGSSFLILLLTLHKYIFRKEKRNTFFAVESILANKSILSGKSVLQKHVCHFRSVGVGGKKKFPDYFLTSSQAAFAERRSLF